MLIPIILFALAAGGGVVLASLRLRGRDLPMGLALVHGAAAAVGLAALLFPVMAGRASGGARTALILFAVAALGGFLLFSFHLRRRQLPIPLMLVHGLAAVTAFGVLLLGALGRG